MFLAQTGLESGEVSVRALLKVASRYSRAEIEVKRSATDRLVMMGKRDSFIPCSHRHND